MKSMSNQGCLEEGTLRPHPEQDEEHVDQGCLEEGTLRPHPEQDEEHVESGMLGRRNVTTTSRTR